MYYEIACRVLVLVYPAMAYRMEPYDDAKRRHYYR